MTIARRKLKVKVIGQGQGRGSGDGRSDHDRGRFLGCVLIMDGDKLIEPVRRIGIELFCVNLRVMS